MAAAKTLAPADNVLTLYLSALIFSEFIGINSHF
jgi:hypothetical protein